MIPVAMVVAVVVAAVVAAVVAVVVAAGIAATPLGMPVVTVAVVVMAAVAAVVLLMDDDGAMGDHRAVGRRLTIRGARIHDGRLSLHVDHLWRRRRHVDDAWGRRWRAKGDHDGAGGNDDRGRADKDLGVGGGGDKARGHKGQGGEQRRGVVHVEQTAADLV